MVNKLIHNSSRFQPFERNERMNIFFHQHRYNTVKTVKSRTVSTGQKGSKSTQSCLKRYVNEDLTVGYFVCLMITFLSILYNLLATLLFGSLTIAIFNKLTYLRTLAKNVIAIASAR